MRTTTIHGFPIIAYKPSHHFNDSAYIICDRGEDSGHISRYVVWFMDIHTGHCVTGAYYFNLTDALNDFNRR